MANELAVISIERIEHSILLMRGQKVVLDADLAFIYGTTTKVLNQAVQRNRMRFPDDFTFQLTLEECLRLRSQIVTSKKGRGGRRYLPYAFTEHGAIMAASVLNSKRAVQASLFVVRAFVKMRELLSTQTQLALKLDELETRLDGHDQDIHKLLGAIRQLAAPLKARRGRRIGFQSTQMKPMGKR